MADVGGPDTKRLRQAAIAAGGVQPGGTTVTLGLPGKVATPVLGGMTLC